MDRRRPPLREANRPKESRIEKLGAPRIIFNGPSHANEYVIVAERFPRDFKIGSELESFHHFYNEMCRQLQYILGEKWSVENRGGARIEIIRRIREEELPPIDPGLRGIARLDKLRELEKTLYRDHDTIVAAVRQAFGEKYDEPLLRDM